MRPRLVWMLVAAGLLSGCREQKMEVMEDSGQQIYMARCAVCHGENGEGAGMYPALAGSEWVNGAPERLAAIILDGMEGRVGNYQAVMPGWGSVLKDSEIAAVMTWVRARAGKGTVTAAEVNHARVETAGRNTFWTAEDLRNLQVR